VADLRLELGPGLPGAPNILRSHFANSAVRKALSPQVAADSRLPPMPWSIPPQKKIARADQKINKDKKNS